MIGHKMNGGVILAMAPADRDHYVVLHYAEFSVGGGKAQWATGLIHHRQLVDGNVSEWWIGHYFEHWDNAIEDFVERSTNDLDTITLLVRRTERHRRSKEALS